MTNASTGCNRLIQMLPTYTRIIKTAVRHVIVEDNENQQKHDIS
jgi:hypothetical protein